MLSLEPDDRVALVAPAGQIRTRDRAWLDAASELLESWGLRVDVKVESDHHFYLAGHDDNRAAHLVLALTDPDIRAIFCTRGGYGSSRLWPHLRNVSVPSPRLLVGFSDITSLHLMAEALWPQVDSVHAPNVATAQLFGDHGNAAVNQARLHDNLFSPRAEIHAIERICSGRAEGPIMGGCLSLIASSLGTLYSPETSGAILFLEDTGEAPYRLDRSLVHLRNAGVFDSVAGVVFGVMPGCTDPHNDFRDIVAELLSPLGVPVGIGFTSGHGDVNTPVRLGSGAVFDTAKGTLQIGL